MERLLARGQAVRAVSRRFDSRVAAAWEDRLDLVEADFTNPLSTLSTVQGLDTVIQLISSSSPGMGNRVLVDDIQENVIPHVSFIQKAISAGVRRYIFVSSGGTVYGPNAPVPTAETAHTNPINSHGMTKLMIEKYLQMFSRVDGLEYVILRVSNPYGPGQTFRKGQGLIPAILQRQRESLPIQIFGDGSSQRDYIYIDDLTAAVEKVVDCPSAGNEVFNIGKGEGRSILEVIETLEATLGVCFEKEFLPGRNTDVSRSVLDISKACRLLSWAPGISLEEGVERMLVPWR
ncbi:NAD-dependent epimerase/dehydratase family protein [Yangia sp. PrR002]|nr:NAD-dependent epimerase/dehydratase family protein [Salipiger sp. PrR002]NDW58868.1 NAD-dependent epimerase/dehydratase family protein [Salipiger sp. PrR004]